MPNVGQILRNNVGISFLCAVNENGSPLEQPQEQGEILMSAGCDGKRWRTVSTQFPSFVMRTVSESADYPTAIITRRKVESLSNKLVQLSLTIAGSNYLWKDAHVDAVRAQAIAGPVIAVGSTGGTAHLIVEWSLTLTDFEQVGKA